MPCERGQLPGGVFFVACTRRPKGNLTSCKHPGCRRPCVALCDYPVTRSGRKGTCDAELCGDHRKRVGKNRDFCVPHARLAESLKPADAATATGQAGDREVPGPGPTPSVGTDPTGTTPPPGTGPSGGGAGGAEK
jgi:hypothetical protein